MPRQITIVLEDRDEGMMGATLRQLAQAVEQGRLREDVVTTNGRAVGYVLISPGRQEASRETP
jgi:hypothetical protein